MKNETRLDANQLYYLRTVLGIDSVVFPENFDPSSLPVSGPMAVGEVRWAGPAEGARLLALLPTPSQEFPLSEEARALLEKMILAMKLQLDEVRFASWPYEVETLAEEVVQALAVGGERQPVLLFGAFGWKSLTGQELSPGDIAEFNGRRVFATFSPGELLQNPSQKRLAWVHLQKLMKEL